MLTVDLLALLISYSCSSAIQLRNMSLSNLFYTLFIITHKHKIGLPQAPMCMEFQHEFSRIDQFRHHHDVNINAAYTG